MTEILCFLTGLQFCLEDMQALDISTMWIFTLMQRHSLT